MKNETDEARNWLENWQDLRDNTEHNQSVDYPTTLVSKPEEN